MTHHKPNIEFRLMTNAIIENNYNQENIFYVCMFCIEKKKCDEKTLILKQYWHANLLK
jgi:hypothetical protein